uniref:Uncharacterized protein n=1 Tax=Arundo donax TaxID=35708 RepID=A0A0A9FEP7_ARUDO
MRRRLLIFHYTWAPM